MFKSGKISRNVLDIIVVSIEVIIIGFILEIGAGDIDNYLKKYKIWEQGRSAILISLAAMFIIIWIFLRSKISQASEEHVNIISDRDPKILIQKLRVSLKGNYEDRIHQKLADRLPINIQLQYDLRGTNKKSELYDNKTIEVNLIKEEITDLYNKHRGRLLITGEPGSGKTALILHLAISLIHSKDKVVPILLNIATWRDRFVSINDWLVELLPMMGYSKALANFLIDYPNTIFLFDGLDELHKSSRANFLKCLGEFGKAVNVKFVITSRIREYAETYDAPVYCQVRIRPLSLFQIKTQLQKIDSPGKNGMLSAIHQNKNIATVAKNPFYFNTLQYLFASGKTLDELHFKSNNISKIEVEVVDKFIEEMFSISKVDEAKLFKWTAFLAKRMNEKEIINFELLDLQYDWVRKWSQEEIDKAYFVQEFGNSFGWAMIFSIIGFPLLAIKFIFNNSIYCIIFFIFIGSFIIAVFYGAYLMCTSIFLRYLKEEGGRLIASLFTSSEMKSPDLTIYTKDRIGLNQQKINKALVEATNSLGMSIIISIFLFGFAVYTGDWHTFIKYIFPLLIFFTIGGFLITLIQELLMNLYSKDDSLSYILINQPYQRFQSSMKNLKFSIFDHFYLRWRLFRRGIFPFRVVRFLQELVNQHILESDGAIWRFRHKILQDNFAKRFKVKEHSDL